MLKSTAIPSLIIKRVRYGKLDYPEITTNLHSDEKQKVDDMEDIACSCSSIISNPPKEPEMDRVECLKLSSSNGKIANANDSPVSKSISKSSNIFNKESSTKVNGNIFVEASVVEDNETPRRQFLKRGISVLANDTNLKSKKIKMLNQTIRSQRKTIVSLKCIISNLEDHNLTRSLPQ
ncbi:uncharacterized protein LOC111039998 [Myzus persicae]|uniref:uncharacterized protein LOC111039998 n=1 Tax=Myzus persicae TaxID=13164 RepID=UPI000B936F55|nr:uncharacterized protein LOC111039998 [Myzus persicae]